MFSHLIDHMLILFWMLTVDCASTPREDERKQIYWYSLIRNRKIPTIFHIVILKLQLRGVKFSLAHIVRFWIVLLPLEKMKESRYIGFPLIRNRKVRTIFHIVILKLQRRGVKFSLALIVQFWYPTLFELKTC